MKLESTHWLEPDQQRRKKKKKERRKNTIEQIEYVKTNSKKLLDRTMKKDGSTRHASVHPPIANHFAMKYISREHGKIPQSHTIFLT